MKCHNCSKPALFLVGPESNIPLCLDCTARFREMQVEAVDTSARAINYLTSMMEARVGLPGVFPRYPTRQPRPLVQGAKVTLHHINVHGGNIGVLNTGHIGSIDTAIGSIVEGGEAEGAKALAEFSGRLVALAEVDATTKNRVLELLSVIAAEATQPAQRRRSAAMRPILAELSTITSGIADLAQLYMQYAPAIAALFASTSG